MTEELTEEQIANLHPMEQDVVNHSRSLQSNRDAVLDIIQRRAEDPANAQDQAHERLSQMFVEYEEIWQLGEEIGDTFGFIGHQCKFGFDAWRAAEQAYVDAFGWHDIYELEDE